MARFLRATLPQPSIAGADDRLDPLCYLQLGKDARDVFVFQIGTQVETQALGTVDYKVHIDLDSNAATVQISRNHAMTPTSGNKYSRTFFRLSAPLFHNLRYFTFGHR